MPNGAAEDARGIGAGAEMRAAAYPSFLSGLMMVEGGGADESDVFRAGPAAPCQEHGARNDI